jgi:hypothetical protein
MHTQDRLLLLEQWLEPLRNQHAKTVEEEKARSQDRQAQAEKEERVRKEKERYDKELKEMAEFRPVPLVVIHDYENDNLKLLRHAVCLCHV